MLSKVVKGRPRLQQWGGGLVRRGNPRNTGAQTLFGTNLELLLNRLRRSAKAQFFLTVPGVPGILSQKSWQILEKSWQISDFLFY